MKRGILVVDDDDDNRELLVELLEAAGYWALGVPNGAAALASLEAGSAPDLVLTDMIMPVMNGWELCAALKNSPVWRSIPIIVLCGLRPRERGELQVADAFTKPTDITALLRRIAELCGTPSAFARPRAEALFEEA